VFGGRVGVVENFEFVRDIGSRPEEQVCELSSVARLTDCNLFRMV
jgi:hypothetical protein